MAACLLVQASCSQLSKHSSDFFHMYLMPFKGICLLLHGQWQPDCVRNIYQRGGQLIFPWDHMRNWDCCELSSRIQFNKLDSFLVSFNFYLCINCSWQEQINNLNKRVRFKSGLNLKGEQQSSLKGNLYMDLLTSSLRMFVHI